MSALSHYIEDEGIATTGISLVREHTERMQPPRALWVPYELGRPLGVPSDAAFQHRVMAAALALLDAKSGPVLEDYPEEAPVSGSGEGWSCPVSFSAAPTDDSDPVAAVAREMDSLKPWFEMSMERRRRTTIRAGVDQIDKLLELVATPLTSPDKAVDAREFKHAIEDLKVFYLEAATARPGELASAEVNAWLWGETALATLYRTLGEHLAESQDDALRHVAESVLVPRIYS